jgi:hypothetical protein
VGDVSRRQICALQARGHRFETCCAHQEVFTFHLALSSRLSLTFVSAGAGIGVLPVDDVLLAVPGGSGVPGGFACLDERARDWRGGACAGGESGGWPRAAWRGWLWGRGGEAGEGCAAPAAGAEREPGGGALGVAGLAGGPGGHDPLVADGEQARGEQGDRGRPMRRHQPRLMSLLAGSLAVEKVRSAAVRRA